MQEVRAIRRSMPESCVEDRLSRLAGARRVFDRLDWWRVTEWASSELWSFDGDAAALLLAPIDLDCTDALDHTHAQVAWVRWCAMADGQSASQPLRAMFREAEARLRQHGTCEVRCIVRASDWLAPYLHDLGYQTVDRMLTFQAEAVQLASTAALPTGVTLRDGTAEDLPAVCDLDARAFDQPWQYPLPLMRRAFAQALSTTVAVCAGQIIGYQCSLLHDGSGHVVRLAVEASMRHRKIGAALLAECAKELTHAGARTITLNTQQSNTGAQRLYRRLGFQQLDEKPEVMRKWIAGDGAGGEA